MTHTEVDEDGNRIRYGTITGAKRTGVLTDLVDARDDIYTLQTGSKQGKLTPAQARRAKKKYNRAQYEAERLSLKAERRIVRAEQQRKRASVWKRFEQMLAATKPKTKAQVEAEKETPQRKVSVSKVA